MVFGYIIKKTTIKGFVALILSGIRPERVLYYFENICSIPHGSGNCEEVSKYCINVAKTLGLRYSTDEHFNVIIKKDATKGYENKPTVILQGHLDMVCEKDDNCNIDFSKDAIELKLSGDLISANGTTLGGDDGIAVAMALAILEDDTLKHPTIEALFTTDEETGMYGAVGLDATVLNGKMLINIDSENEGVFTVGCAGGARAEITIPVECVDLSGDCYEITVSGLIGGHSGVEIDKGRLNANVILGKFLESLPFEYNISDISGGLKDNAIPRSSKCVLYCKDDPNNYVDAFVNANRIDTDGNLNVSVKRIEGDGKGFSLDSSEKIVEFLCTVPNGIQAMSKDIEGLVETSLNLGILFTDSEGVHASFAVRSSVNSEKTKLLLQLKNIAENLGGSFSEHGHYPAWEYRKNSVLRDKMVSVYEELYGKSPIVETIHAGLECGILGDKISDLDAVSIGPDMWDIHTPRERISVSSIKRVYEFVCKLLSEI